MKKWNDEVRARSDQIPPDEIQFEELIYPFKHGLLNYCKRLTGSGWDGEDLYQETILKAYRRYQRWPERELSKPYLYRIAVNCWIDICRREKLMMHPEALTESNAVSYSEWSRYDVREALEWLMDSLEPRQVVLILLMDVFGFTPKETEAALNQSVTVIKSALYRARQRLKKEAEPNLIGIEEEAVATAHAGHSAKSQNSLQLFERFIEAFRQADVNAMFEEYRTLTSCNLQVERIVHLQNSVYFYFTDPDGNSLMIISHK